MEVINIKDVNKTKLNEIINKAGIETVFEGEDDTLYAKAGGIDFGVFIDCYSDDSRIRFFTYLGCKEGVESKDLLKLTAALNSNYKLVKFTSAINDEKRAFVYGEYEIFYNFGLPVENFIVTLKKFANFYIESLKSEDKKDVFFD